MNNIKEFEVDLRNLLFIYYIFCDDDTIFGQ